MINSEDIWPSPIGMVRGRLKSLIKKRLHYFWTKWFEAENQREKSMGDGLKTEGKPGTEALLYVYPCLLAANVYSNIEGRRIYHISDRLICR
jgi:hypothetical protein